jgi:hypothetical protein
MKASLAVPVEHFTNIQVREKQYIQNISIHRAVIYTRLANTTWAQVAMDKK